MNSAMTPRGPTAHEEAPNLGPLVYVLNVFTSPQTVMQLNKLVHPTLLVPDSSSRAVTILLDGLLLLSFYGTSIVSEVALALMG